MSLNPTKTRLRRLLAVFAFLAIGVTAFYSFEFYRSGQAPAVFFLGSSPRHRGNQTPNYSKIEDGLWLGGYVEKPPAGTQAVLNLCGSKDPYEVELSRVDAIHDGPPAPSIEWLDRQVTFIESQRAAGRNVYVHCQGGVSRSATVTAAYFMRREGWSADRAIQFLQSKRPVVSPNPAFRPLLAEWEQMVKANLPALNATQP